MTRNQTIAMQGLAILGQTVIPTMPVSPEWKAFAHGLLAAAQGILAVLAHNHNPDGTTAKVAYMPERDR